MTGTTRHKPWIRLFAATALLALSGCGDMFGPTKSSLKPQTRPGTATAVPPQVAQPTSKKSALLRQYFNQVHQAQISQGLLRQDGGGIDTPFNAEMLARNFEQIAFYNEYDSNLTGRGGASPLRRWADPVRMEVIFGDGIVPSLRKNISDDINAYSRRLSRASGHPISTIGEPNFLIIVASEDDRSASLAEAADRIPDITDLSLNALRNLRRDTYCAVAAFAGGSDPNTYTAAVAVIRAENPDLLLQACIHEELAQGLGLANDSPTARPSIFNDDDEFALLTDHDELLLRMLYDPRLKPGMSATEAAPLTRIIARELTSGPS